MNKIKRGKKKGAEKILRDMDFEEQMMIAKINTERKNNPAIIRQTMQERNMSPEYARHVIVALGGISNEEIIAAIKPMSFEESKKFLRNLPYKQRDKFTSEYFNRLNNKNYAK